MPLKADHDARQQHSRFIKTLKNRSITLLRRVILRSVQCRLVLVFRFILQHGEQHIGIMRNQLVAGYSRL